jgi:hypothetical protein
VFLYPDGPGMGFSKCAIIIDFTDEITGSNLNNLKPIAAAAQIDVPMRRLIFVFQMAIDIEDEDDEYESRYCSSMTLYSSSSSIYGFVLSKP